MKDSEVWTAQSASQDILDLSANLAVVSLEPAIQMEAVHVKMDTQVQFSSQNIL